MPRLRPFAALLLSLVLAIGTLASAARACEEGPRGPQPAETAHHHGETPDPASSEHHDGCALAGLTACAVPGAPMSCGASGSASLAVSVAGPSSMRWHTGGVPVARRLGALSRVGAAPDVPPPRG